MLTITKEKQQELFDQVVAGLALQGFQTATDVNGCLYRAPNGRKCGIGQLIKDEDYDPVMERNGVYQSVVYRILEKSTGIEPTRENLNWFGDLQGCHDNACFERSMEQNLVLFAKSKDLVVPPTLLT